MDEMPSPELDWATAMGLLEGDFSRVAGVPSLLGAFLPGVDGDVAGLVSHANGFESQAVSSLEHEARRAGFDWLPLSEAEFASALAAPA